MSEKHLHRRRLPGNNRKFKPLHSFSSTHKHHPRRVVIHQTPKKPLKLIRRCHSEPVISAFDDHYIDVGGTVDDVVIQPRDCVDVCWSSPEIVLPYSPRKVDQGYNKDSKVVMNVTVEGSSGPVRAMVKLGSSVEETMKIFKRQYNLEGRSPQLDQHSISPFELHSSYFSLQCLDTSETIGDIDSRSFIMRKCNNDDSYMRSDIISTAKNNSESPNPVILFPNFISLNFKKIGRLSSKLCKIFGCVDG